MQWGEESELNPGCAAPGGKIVPVVLAAGDSGRMGYPKALLPLGEGTFVSRILATIGEVGLPDPIVVLGKHAEMIMESLQGLAFRPLINPKPESGQLSSIKLAVQALGRDAGGCMIWPVDQPAVSAGLVNGLIRSFGAADPLLAIPRCRNRRGHPVIIRSLLFRELLAIPEGKGAKSLVRRYADRAALLETEENAVLEDVDTPADYYRLTGEELPAALARRGISWSASRAGRP